MILTTPLYSTQFYLSGVEVQHSRSVYNTFDLFGDVAGVLELITMMFAIFIGPMIE
jgi:hypothetical protein